MHPYQKWLNRLILVLTGIRRLPRHISVFGTRFWFREAKKLRGLPAIPCLGRENSQLRLQQPGKSFPNTLFNLNIYLSIKMVGDGYLLRFFLLVSIFLVGKLLSGLFFFFFSYPGQCFFLFTFFLESTCFVLLRWNQTSEQYLWVSCCWVDVGYILGRIIQKNIPISEMFTGWLAQIVMGK